MANAAEVSALNRIKLHLLGELSPLATPLNYFDESNPSPSESSNSQSSSVSLNHYFTDLFEFDSKPQIIDLQTPKTLTSAQKKPQLNRKPSLLIAVPKKTEWIQFGSPDPNPVMAAPENLPQKNHYRGNVERKRRREEEEVVVEERKPVVKKEKITEQDVSCFREMPLTPSMWTGFWDSDVKDIFNVPPLSPLSPFGFSPLVAV
ncbi:Ethylene-responsive transcription factor 6 [Glycine soja]|nr:Ethylene-responsive transcription factor 6 [Glycine soja]